MGNGKERLRAQSITRRETREEREERMPMPTASTSASSHTMRVNQGYEFMGGGKTICCFVVGNVIS